MSDIKLFRLTNGSAKELVGKPVKLEKRLQALIEKHLEMFLHVRFVASEYSTGKTHAGRIDTLGIDENFCPTIIEYKRNSNANVTNLAVQSFQRIAGPQVDPMLAGESPSSSKNFSRSTRRLST